MTCDIMKKFLVSIFIILLSLTFVCCCDVQAQNNRPKVVVLSDISHRNGTTYLICGAASDIIASDIINTLNQTGRVNAPLLGENMSNITQKSLPLYHATFFKEYKYNYNIDFVNLKRVTKNLNADYLIMVTSGIDVQSQFLKETWWAKWGISSSEPISPTYKLTTLVTLIDAKRYEIMWQDIYGREIKSENMDLGIAQFSPSYAQLEKIKKYSKNMSEYVVHAVDKKINPWAYKQKSPKMIEMQSTFVNEGTKVYYPTVNGEVVKENVGEFAQNTKQKIQRYKSGIESKKRKKMDNAEQNKDSDSLDLHQISVPQKDLNSDNFKNLIDVKPDKIDFDVKEKQNKQLYESINNNIDDVSNSLPAPREQKQYIIVPKTQVQEVEKSITPETTTIKHKTKKSESKNVPAKKQINDVKKDDNLNKDWEKELPRYDWNLKNIHLEEIGNVKRDIA